MRDTELQKKKIQAGAIFLSAILLTMAWFTLHDMQTAEGIGLYYVIHTGAEIGTVSMGIIVECTGLLAMLVLLLIPCIMFRRMKPESFLRIFLAYLAFMPTVSMGYLVHLQNGTEKITCSEALLAGDLWRAFRYGVSEIFPLLSAGIPLLILTAAAANQRKKRRTRLIMLMILTVLLATAVIFPALKDICNYFVRYLLLVYGFSLWEYLYEIQPKYRKWSWLIFGILGLRAVYIMAELMSIYHV